MVKHYIILSSSYSKGIRIALHYLFTEVVDSNYMSKVLQKIKKECGDDVSISTHYLITDSISWDSVCVKDSFFEDVHKIEKIEEFISLIKMDRVLNGLDLAKYILSMCKCTHLKLEKLIYLCYADYLCKYDKKLFHDIIYAFKYGPVIKTVYEMYKGTNTELQEFEDTCEMKFEDAYSHLPARSRILFAIEGMEKLQSIDETIKEYCDCTASCLVDLTHKQNSPWAMTYTGVPYEEINDEVIKKYHKFT